MSFFATGAIFVIANFIDVLRRDPCCDFIVRRGFPFAILRRGGFVDVHQYLPVGIAANLLVVLLIASAIARIWEGVSRERNSAPE
jgi:hypothetical protein